MYCAAASRRRSAGSRAGPGCSRNTRAASSAVADVRVEDADQHVPRLEPELRGHLRRDRHDHRAGFALASSLGPHRRRHRDQVQVAQRRDALGAHGRKRLRVEADRVRVRPAARARSPDRRAGRAIRSRSRAARSAGGRRPRAAVRPRGSRRARPANPPRRGPRAHRACARHVRLDRLDVEAEPRTPYLAVLEQVPGDPAARGRSESRSPALRCPRCARRSSCSRRSPGPASSPADRPSCPG